MGNYTTASYSAKALKTETNLNAAQYIIERVTGFQAIVQGISACGCQLYMTPLKKIREYRDFQSCDSNKYMHFHKLLMKNGVFTHPAQMEHMLVSTADTEQDIEKALESQQHRLLRS